jgi:hypothetical protein
VFHTLSRRDQREIGRCVLLLLALLYDLFAFLDDSHHALARLGAGRYPKLLEAFLDALHLPFGLLKVHFE